jgi:hypothetical protein
MATIGLSPEQAEAVAGMLSEVEAATLASADEKQDAGKEKARERWRRWKANQTPANDGKRLQTATNVSKPLARAEDSSSTSSLSGSDVDTSPPARSKRGERIPADFEPDTEWAMAQGLSPSEASHEAAQFIDYWRSKPGKDGLKLDWPGTWRMWVRNSIKRHRSQPAPRSSDPPPRKPRNAGEAARLELIRRGEYPDATSYLTGSENQGDRNTGFAGTDIARRIAIAAGG